MRRIAIFIIIMLAVFTFINAYSAERDSRFEEARFSTVTPQQNQE